MARLAAGSACSGIGSVVAPRTKRLGGMVSGEHWLAVGEGEAGAAAEAPAAMSRSATALSCWGMGEQGRLVKRLPGAEVASSPALDSRVSPFAPVPSGMEGRHLVAASFPAATADPAGVETAPSAGRQIGEGATVPLSALTGSRFSSGEIELQASLGIVPRVAHQCGNGLRAEWRTGRDQTCMCRSQRQDMQVCRFRREAGRRCVGDAAVGDGAPGRCEQPLGRQGSVVSLKRYGWTPSR